MATTPGELDAVALKVGRLADMFDGRQLDAIATKVGVAAKRDVTDQVGRDIGRDQRMSNWGRFKFRSGFEVDRGMVDLRPRPVNPWRVLEQGRKGGHKIPKGRRRRKVYRTPQGLRTATREKPWVGSSSRGLRTWTKSAVKIERESGERVQEAVREQLRDIWRL